MTTDPYHLVNAALADLGRLRRLLYEGLARRMAEAEAGLSAVRPSMTGNGGDPADPTAGRALAADDDPARAHQAALALALRTAAGEARLALTLADLYPPPHVADAEDRAELARINGRAEPSCQNCARTRRPDGGPRWEPIDARRTEATTVGGRLVEPILLCRWCYDRVASWGRLPRLDELERHHRGERVPWPGDVPRTEAPA